jgi:hypothetical protein
MSSRIRPHRLHEHILNQFARCLAAALAVSRFFDVWSYRERLGRVVPRLLDCEAISRRAAMRCGRIGGELESAGLQQPDNRAERGGGNSKRDWLAPIELRG